MEAIHPIIKATQDECKKLYYYCEEREEAWEQSKNNMEMLICALRGRYLS